jgi:SAM-dependent methyltransferase
VTADRDYVHGYSSVESTRLVDQATTLTELLHHDTLYPPGSLVLEAGCGVGAQTVTLATRSPDQDPLARCLGRLAGRRPGAPGRGGVRNVTLGQADLYRLPLGEASVDHVFLCFVLEHLARVPAALGELTRVLRPGGTLTVIEGDHGSTYFHPDSPDARRAIQCLVDLQARAGGDALIGRSLYPLLRRAGLEDVRVSPRMVYVDDSRPHLVDGFIRKTFTAMVEGVGPRAVAEGLIDQATWDRGIRDLYRTARPDGTFCYCFFKAIGRRP